MREYTSNSEKETEEIAAELAKTLKKGDVVCLDGDLGAGKTAFVRGLARGMGLDAHVSSPTFTIVNEYGSGDTMLYHFDVYRIGSEDELYEIGFDEYIFGEGISVIEWSENIQDSLPDKRLEIKIMRRPENGDDFRTITIEEIK